MKTNNVLCMHPMIYRTIIVESLGIFLLKQERCKQCGKVIKTEIE